jgi:hypothetical protein
MRLWASEMLERKTVKYKFKLTAVALANKVAVAPDVGFE